jgi:hypothetical protein
MIRRYGRDGAVAEAAAHSGQLASEGDEIGANVWRLVGDAIAEIERATPASGEAIH